VFVLIGEETFSAAEEFAYDLQALGRGTLIGQRTRGGAHMSVWVPVTPHFDVSVPYARALNPITGTNWEGTGVQPDVEVPAEAAFDRACELALRAVAESPAAARPEFRDEIQQALGDLGAANDK